MAKPGPRPGFKRSDEERARISASVRAVWADPARNWGLLIGLRNMHAHAGHLPPERKVLLIADIQGNADGYENLARKYGISRRRVGDLAREIGHRRKRGPRPRTAATATLTQEAAE